MSVEATPVRSLLDVEAVDDDQARGTRRSARLGNNPGRKKDDGSIRVKLESRLARSKLSDRRDDLDLSEDEASSGKYTFSSSSDDDDGDDGGAGASPTLGLCDDAASPVVNVLSSSSDDEHASDDAAAAVPTWATRFSARTSPSFFCSSPGETRT